MYKLLLAGLLPLLSYGQDLAVAQFGMAGDFVEGWINVTDGEVTVYLNLSVAVANMGSFPWNEACLNSSMSWHIHQKFNHSTDTWKNGSNCGPDFTGGHIDPWLGCGPATGNSLCDAKGGCVPGSSSSSYGTYTCTTSSYAESPYYCEVGDWSGKYGKLSLDSDNILSGTFSSFYEVDAADLEGRSVVFHCKTGARMFCAPFTVQSNGGYDARPNQTVDYLVAEIGDGYLELNGNGDYAWEVSAVESFTSSECSGDVDFFIFDDWTSDMDYIWDISGSECAAAVGDGAWDPTASCYTNMTSNEYCWGETATCNISEYSCAFNSDPYSCAPGDMSGKWGSISASQLMSGSGASLTGDGNDYTMPDLSLIQDRSVGFVCDHKIIACAKFSDSRSESWSVALSCQFNLVFVLILSMFAFY